MHPTPNPYGNEAGLIDKFIGTAYEHVKAVAAELPKIKHISDNMQAVFDFAAALEVMEAFTENPDFLTWLQDNEQNLESLATDLSSLVQDYAPLAGASFTGFVKIGDRGVGIKHIYLSGSTPVIGAENVWPHLVDPSKIVGIQGTVTSLHGEIVALSAEGTNVKVWADATYLRVSVGEEAVDYGNRPFNVILTIIE